jgi:nitroreductase
MEFYDVIARRRSIRRYDPRPVPGDVLQRVWGAVAAAPTACNRQPFQFLLAQSDAAKAAVYAAYHPEWIRSAPVVAIAVGNREQAWKRSTGVSAHTIDVAIAMQHLVLAAAAEGLGTCWICAFDQQRLHRDLKLTPEWDVVALTPIGFAAETPAAITRKPVSDLFRVI